MGRLVLPGVVLAGMAACATALPRPVAAQDEAPAAAADQEPTTNNQQPAPAGLDADAALALTPDECFAQLDEWGVPYERAADAPATIDAPLRLTGPVAGVTFDVPWRATNHQDVLDCRLAVALAQWAVLLRAQGVVEVRVYSFYRGGPRIGVASARARSQPSQHDFGLAVDAGWFELDDGTELEVRRDFVDPGGAHTCPAAGGDDPAARLLGLYCAAWAARLFHVQLSPAHNAQHENHFHLDLGGGNGGWYLD